ncbi:MAG: hypothetical protein HY814_01465 [Candidatus Riflebacteria bacterium]|nr:hypothetical protein [Candidatus Riflebacteria bacterium]
MSRPFPSGAVRRMVRIGAVLLLYLVATEPARATILEKIEFDRLCQTSETIVVGKCAGKVCRWDRAHQTILTVYSFTVSEALKGQPTPTVEVVTLGGVIGTQGLGVAGSPSFRNDEEYVLFLERAPEGSWRCRGWTQGRYEVFLDPKANAKAVRGDTSGAALLRKASGKLEEGGPGRPMSLSTFLDTVRTESAKGGPH